MLKFAKKKRKTLESAFFFAVTSCLNIANMLYFFSWKVSDLTPFLRIEQIYKFPKEYEDLYEMRIPKQARGGVFRIYFCMSLRKLNTLILLCAELKHKTKPMKLETAMQKMKQYKELVKQGVMS